MKEPEPAEAAPQMNRDEGMESAVEAIADEYLDRLRAGEAVDRAALLSAHPELGGRLEEELALVELLHRAGAASRSRTPGAAGEDAGPAPVAGAPPGGAVGLFPGDPPGIVGPYRIRRALGTGGMGEVYLAEQASPIRRDVALKLIKLGMDTREVLARFDAERQALAVMSHPNIARVFDAGATLDGRPYFAMEYVPGRPITEFCDEGRLSTPERTKLFLQVCEAVQHAHQKGVIHRDLKPANVLVSLVDGRAVPKVIDFGVAKATDQQRVERTAFTELGRMIGTPEYMSPEQASADPTDVDTRTDIYSLGAMFYELLVGAQPFDGRAMRSMAYEEIRRRIREEQPARPSTRLSSLGEARTEIATRRRTDPSRLERVLRGDLDWITMKAMEKERGRRYATASELAEDIRRHLNDEPVSAGPPGLAYRIGKLARRRKGAAAAAAILSLALLGTTVVSVASALLVRGAWERESAARIAADAARVRATEEASAAEEARAREEAQREVAERALREAESEAAKAKVISNFLQGILISADPRREGKDVKVVDLLTKASARIGESFRDRAELQGSLRGVLAKAYFALGLLEEAEREERSALELLRSALGQEDPATLREMNDLAVVLQNRGQLEEAERLQSEVLEARMRLRGEESPETLTSLANLGRSIADRGGLDEAEEMCRRVVEGRRRVLGKNHRDTVMALSDLASILMRRGRLDEAAPILRQALDVNRESLGPDHPDTLIVMGNLAGVLEARGRPEEALPLVRDVARRSRRVLGEEHPQTLIAMNNLALLQDELGRKEAETTYRRVLEIRIRVLGERHPDTLLSTNNLAVYLKCQGKMDEAEPLYHKVLDIRREVLGEDHPDTLESIRNLASLVQSRGRLEEAESLFRQALDGMRSALGEEHPATLRSMNSLGLLLQDRGELGDAEDLFRKTLDVKRRVLGEAHPSTLSTLHNLGRTLHSLGRNDEAERLYEEGLATAGRALREDHPLALALMDGRALLLLDSGRIEEANDLAARVAALAEGAFASGDIRLALYGRTLGACLAAAGRYAEAETRLQRALESLRERFGIGNRETRKALKNLVDLYDAWGRPERSREYRALLFPGDDPEPPEGPGEPGGK